MAKTPWSEKQSGRSRDAHEHELMSWNEIAALLGISRNAAWQACKRAEQKIAAALTGLRIPPQSTVTSSASRDRFIQQAREAWLEELKSQLQLADELSDPTYNSASIETAGGRGRRS